MKIKRREFLGFFLVGTLASLIIRRFWPLKDEGQKVARFWRRTA